MKIVRMLSQHRRDFSAMLECEHCSATQTLIGGYDDEFFHANVIPTIKCKSCGEVAPDSYKPQGTKYRPTQII